MSGLTSLKFSRVVRLTFATFSAVQIQQSWAYTNNVNFLGSGANRPLYGSGGSGIFSGKLGALSSIMTGDATTKLLVQEIPKIPGTNFNHVPSKGSIGSNFESLHLTRDPLDDYTYRNIDLSGRNSFQICHQFDDESLCCDFDIEVVDLQDKVDNSVGYL